MATVGLIPRRPGAWIGPPNAARSSAFLEFDATLKESHRGRNVVTRQPVEKGVDITDHVRPEPDELSLDVVFTNSPINTAPNVIFNTNASDSYKELLDLKSQAQFLTVSTSLRDYQNMIISSLDVDRDAKSGQILAAKIGFQSVLTVESATVSVAEPAKPSGKPQKNAGTLPTSDASNEDTVARAGLKALGF